MAYLTLAYDERLPFSPLLISTSFEFLLSMYYFYNKTNQKNSIRGRLASLDKPPVLQNNHYKGVYSC